jgi:hypothetical protein
MKKAGYLLCLISVALLTFESLAQEVVATSGSYYEGNGVTMSFTVGEPVTETYVTGNAILTQGFQQPGNFYLQQMLNIPEGWSGISSYIDPLNKGVEGLFSGHENDLVVLASMTGIYYPSQQINTIGNWDYLNGYRIKAENEFSVSFVGTKAATKTVEINAGWSLIPVLSSCETPVEECFEGYTGLTIVKQVAGQKIYWPSFNINTLQTLVPGKSYYVASLDEGSITFPECTKSSITSWPDDKPINRTPWNEIHYSASSHVVAFPGGILNETGIMAGDVIGVFTTEGLCAGRIEITDLSQPLSLVVFGKDPYTGIKDGFDPGEMFRSKIYRSESDTEIEVHLEFNPALPQQGQFTENGLSAVKSVSTNAAGFDKNVQTAEIYPNPSNGIFSLSLNPCNGNIQIVIMDLTGQVLKMIEPVDETNNNTFKIDVTGLPKGMYFVNLTDGNWLEVKKIVIN